MTTADEFLLRLAVDRGLLSREAVDEVRRGEPPPESAGERSFVERVIAAGLVSETDLARLLADEFGHPFVDLRAVQPEPAAEAALPLELARRHRVLPLRLGPEVLQVAMADPLDLEAIDQIAHAVGRRIEVVVATPSQIGHALAGAAAATATDATAAEPETSAVAGQGASPPPALDEPVVALVDQLIDEAVRRHASDLHLEPLAQRLRVRYRVDGALQEGPRLPAGMERALIARFKLIANLSIAERRVPQDGRLRVATSGGPRDFRVASLPTVHGESIVLRLLDQERLRPDLGELGLDQPGRTTLQQLLGLPHGLVLVTGPTGSGKTTTLYSCLQYLNRPDRKIITVEDPIEVQLPGVNQVPVRAATGLTFAAALRAMLRQSPNVVMVGEVRDAETAEVALHAALTGHLVFSTLHTNDAPGAITRLLDLGIKPFLVAAALRAAVAQRLVRRVCPECGAADPEQARRLSPEERAEAGDDRASFRRGAGCPSCYGTGYRGRIGLFEFFVPDERIQPLIHDRANLERIRAAARAGGWRTLREDGLRKAAAGVTTLDDVFAHTVGATG